MSNSPSTLTKVYYAACLIILSCLTLLTVSTAVVIQETKEEVKMIRLILQNDYEYVDQTAE